MLVLIIINKCINTELTKLTNKELSIFISFLIKGETDIITLHEFWCNLHFYDPSEKTLSLLLNLSIWAGTQVLDSIHLHTQSLRNHRFQNPPRKPKLEKESVLIL